MTVSESYGKPFHVPSIFRRVLSFLLRLVLWTVAAIFAISLLAFGLVLLALGLLRSLITGKKPKPVVFANFRRFSPRAPWSSGAARDSTSVRSGDVVDVEVREIRDDKRLP